MEDTTPMQENCQPEAPAKQLEGQKQVFNADFAFVAITSIALYCYTLVYAFTFLM
jgi:hypothetical protein